MAVSTDTVVVCGVEELPPGGRKLVEVGPFGVGVFNVKGNYYALTNYCPHRGGPLCKGEISGTTELTSDNRVVWDHQGEVLRCPWHNWEFAIQTGRTLSEPVKRVKMYPVSVEAGKVVLRIGVRGNA